MFVYDDEDCPQRSVGLKHTKEKQGTGCAFCGATVYQSRLRQPGAERETVCRYLLCDRTRASFKTVSAMRYSAAGVPEATKSSMRVCDDCVARIRLGVSAGLTLRVTPENWLMLDNLRFVVDGR